MILTIFDIPFVSRCDLRVTINLGFGTVKTSFIVMGIRIEDDKPLIRYIIENEELI